MASRYDQAKKCRVGTMDEPQFYAEASQANGTYFRSLMAEWKKRGGTFQWGAGGLGLRAGVEGKQIGVCFLAPVFAGKKDRIEMSLTILGKQIGAARCAALKAALEKAAGTHLKGTSMVSIVEPGDLPDSGRKGVSDALLALL
jgi:hypothetical protein